MFGLLKNKISSFIDSLTKREEQKIGEASPAAAEVEKAAPVPEVITPKPSPEARKPAPVPEVKRQAPAPVPTVLIPEAKKPMPVPEVRRQVPAPVPHAPVPEAKKPTFIPEVRKPAAVAQARPAEEPKKMKVSLSLESKVKGIILGEVEVKEKDIDDLLEALKMSLLEADVAFEVSQSLAEDLKQKLVGKKVKRGEVQKAIRGAVASALRDTLDLRGPDLLKAAEEKNRTGEPLKLLFVGPNGAGKTTTMAKIAEMFMRAGKSVIFSASDSYRAAAIEQTEEHANRLGIKAIKHGYGSDPAAVCFDAVNYAKAHKIDVVLMDTAGRQETNRNLIDELKKIARVAKPDLKIFVGESIAGNALVEQVRSFKEAIGLDGVILTKLDCDAKGGTALSVARASGVPVLFFGVGQRYEDLLPFDPDIVLRQILE